MFASLDRFLDETMLMDKSNRVSSADFAPRQMTSSSGVALKDLAKPTKTEKVKKLTKKSGGKASQKRQSKIKPFMAQKHIIMKCADLQSVTDRDTFGTFSFKNHQKSARQTEKAKHGQQVSFQKSEDQDRFCSSDHPRFDKKCFDGPPELKIDENISIDRNSEKLDVNRQKQHPNDISIRAGINRDSDTLPNCVLTSSLVRTETQAGGRMTF